MKISIKNLNYFIRISWAFSFVFLVSYIFYNSLQNEELFALEKKLLSIEHEKKCVMKDEYSKVYNKIFNSAWASYNFTPLIQEFLEKISQEKNINLEDVKIKKTENENFMDSFFLVLKFSTQDDRLVYDFINTIESLESALVVPQFLYLKRNVKKNPRNLIGGEYVFEIFTKS